MVLSGLGFGLFVPPVIDIVLVNVDTARAGVASGSLATFQQVGGAIGVAAIGILFFGLIGQNAASSVHEVTPELRAALSAELPADQETAAVSMFERCFVLQAQSSDPSVTPEGCDVPSNTSATVSRAYADAARTATADDFARSFTQSLWYQVAIYLGTLVLITRLPKVNPQQLAENADSIPGGA